MLLKSRTMDQKPLGVICVADKRHKYGAQKTEYAGQSFASKLEAAVFQILKLFEKAGALTLLQCQDHVYLTEARILYIPDFKCQASDGEVFYVEAKGFKTPEWMIKKRLWSKYGPGDLWIYEGSHLNPKRTEIIKNWALKIPVVSHL